MPQPETPRDRVRLLKMVTNLHIGGTERQVVNLVLRLDSARFDLHLGCLRRAGELWDELGAAGIPTPEFRIGNFHSYPTLRQGVGLARYLRKHSTQILHSYGFYANVFAIPFARMAGTRVVIASVRENGDMLTPLQRRVHKWACRLADCVLVNAEAIREDLVRQGYSRRKIAVIRNGLSPARFAGRNGDSPLRRELGLPASARLVVSFSRLNPMKGVHYLVEAAAEVARRFPDAQFLVVGDGDNRKDLEEHARRLGLSSRVLFTGFRNDVPEWLSQAAVAVQPSLSEGLSNTLIESLAAGVPVVATRVGGNPEVVEDGVTGLLVPPRNAAALAGAITRLLDDRALAARLGAAGKARAHALFSIDRAVRETEQLYFRLLEAASCR